MKDEVEEEMLPEWKKSLIRAEFIKLYFDSFGTRDCVEITRYTDLFNFHKNQSQDKGKFLFAIVKTNEKSPLIPPNRTEARAKLCKTNSMKIMFPRQSEINYDSSVDFLELCFSGLINQKNDNLLMPNSVIANFFRRFEAKYSSVKDKAKFYKLDRIFKEDLQLRKKHLEIVDDVFGDELQKVNPVYFNADACFSLFMVIEGQLIEYVSKKDSFHIVPEEVNEANVTEKIQNYITKQNKLASYLDDTSKRAPVYYDDIVLFRECLQKQKEETMSTNIGEFIIILLGSILFIVNFMVVIPEGIFYDKKLFIEKTLNYGDIEAVKDPALFNGFLERLINGLPNPKNNIIYLNKNTVLSGMALNYALKVADDPEKLYSTQSNYYEHYAKHAPQSGGTLLVPNTIQQYYNLEKKLAIKQDDIDNTAECTLTLMIFNSDNDIALIDTLKFTFNPFGKVDYTRLYHGFRPFLNKGDLSISLLVLNVFFLLTLLYDTYRVVNFCSNKLIDYFKFHINSFEFSDCLDIVAFIMVLASMIWFYVRLLWRSSTFDIVCPTEEIFVTWVRLGSEMKMYQDFTSVVILLVFFKLIKFIYNSFPALGIVFDTFNLAIKEMLCLFLLCFVMIIGFFFLFQSVVGGYSLSYRNLGNAFISTYLLFVGIFDYSRDFTFYARSHALIPYLWIAFFVLFNLILSNVFFSLIYSTFRDVRQKKQMFNDALFQMSKDSFLDLYQRVLNLIFFKSPQESSRKFKELDKESGDSESKELKLKDKERKETDKEKDVKDKDGKDKEKNEVEAESANVPKVQQMNLLKILKYNFSNLHLETLFKKSVLNLEEFEAKKKDSYYRLRKEMMREYVEELQSNTTKDFDIFLTALLYVIYAIMLVVVIYYQQRLGQIKNAKIFIEKFYIQNGLFSNFRTEDSNFSQRASDMNQFVKSLYIEHLELKPISKYFPYYNGAYSFYGEPFLRVTVRQYNYLLSTQEHKKRFFEETVGGSSFLDSRQCPYPYELTADITTGTALPYDMPGSPRAVDQCGGFVFTIIPNPPMDYVTVNIESGKVGSVILDYFVFSNHKDFLIYSRIELYKNPAGVVKSSINHSLIPFNRYVTLNDFRRVVCEIVYYVFFLIFFLRDSAGIYAILKQKLRQNYIESGTEDIFRKSPLINKFYRFTISSFKNDKGFILILKLVFFSLFKFIYKTLLLVYYLVMSIFEFVFDSIFNFLDVFAIGISIGLIALWFYILSVTSTIDSNPLFPKPIDAATVSNLSKVNHLHSLYSYYTCWQAINAFFLFLRLTQYLKFSQTVYMPFLVFNRSKLIIALYLIFICIVNLGFVFFGYALFTENLLTFRTIGSGLLSLFVILAGKIHQSDLMDMNNDVWRPIFLFFFLSFNSLVFLNFFYSIVLDTYNEIRDRQAKNLGKTTSLNFLINVYRIILGKKEIFVEVCTRYRARVEVVFSEYLDQKAKQAREISSDDNKKKNSKKCCGNLLFSLDIQQRFFEIVEKLSRKCLIEEEPVVDPKDKKKPQAQVIQREKVFDSNSLQNQVSIYHKIIIYLISVANVSFPLVQPEVFESVRREKRNTRKKTNQKSVVESKEERVLNKWDIAFFQEYYGLINCKANSFFKKNIFEKYYYEMGNNLSSMYTTRIVDTTVFNRDRISRLSKETNLTKMDSLFQSDLFMIPSILSKPKRNYHTVVACLKQCQTTGDGKICDDCSRQLEIYDSYSAIIYDIMIKYFFLPTFSNLDDRDLYLGYYVYEMNKDSHNNNQSKNLSKEIPNHKIKLFIHEMQMLWKVEVNEKITLDILDREKAEIEKTGRSEAKQYHKLPMTKDRLFFYYNIWNTIYSILYSASPEEIKRIQLLSKSYELLCKYKEDRKKGIKDSLFNYLFSELNGLKNRKLDMADMEKYNLGKDYDFCEALRYVMRNERLSDQKQLNADDFDKIFLFYSDKEKLMITLKEAREDMFLKERESSGYDVLRFDTYPKVFISLWKEWKSATLCRLFFGYNELLDDHVGYNLLNEMNSTKFLKSNAKNFDLFEYFTRENKAEVAVMFLPPQKFIDEAIRLIKKFYDEKQGTEMSIEKIQTFAEILNHFKENRVNLLVKHKYFTQVFEATLGEIKKGLLRINDHYNFHYHQFLRYNNEVMSPVLKITVGKFFTHAKEVERFAFMCELCKNELKSTEMARYQSKRDTDEDQCIPEKLYENVDELNRYVLSDEKELKRKKLEFVSDESYREIHKNNPFIWILSLDPFEYLEVCQKIRDPDIREFYLEIYIFIYGEDQNKESYYLKRKVKMNFLEKYDSYLKYVKKREEVEKKRDLLLEKEKDLNDAVSYLETRKKQYELLYANWEKEKKGLNDAVAKQNKREQKAQQQP